jgi:hypothetical protein
MAAFLAEAAEIHLSSKPARVNPGGFAVWTIQGPPSPRPVIHSELDLFSAIMKK